jgi:hypothetical protein
MGMSKIQYFPDWIEFPFTGIPGLGAWSIIFRCDLGPFVDLLDPISGVKRVYIDIDIDKLQGAKNHLDVFPPLAPSEEEIPQLSNGHPLFSYEACGKDGNDVKSYDLPVDTCQGTSKAKAINILKPVTCANGTRALIAQYRDDKCKDLHHVAPIRSIDFGPYPSFWACQNLTDTDTSQLLSSVAFYCTGAIEPEIPPDPPNPSIPSKTPAHLPWRPWVSPWRGQYLYSIFYGPPLDDPFSINPAYQSHPADECITHITPLKITQVPWCANFTTANVAFFPWQFCRGTPVFWDGRARETRELVFRLGREWKSMAFWCDGVRPYGMHGRQGWNGAVFAVNALVRGLVLVLGILLVRRVAKWMWVKVSYMRVSCWYILLLI